MSKIVSKRPQQFDFLARSPTIPREALLLIGVLTMIVIAYYCMTHDDSWGALQKWFSDNKASIWNFVLGICASILASFIFIRFYQSDAGQIEKLRRLSDVDFLNQFFGDLMHFRARTCRDYTARIVLSPTPDRDDLLNVNITYSYFKQVTERQLRFKITRIRSSGDKQPDHDVFFFSNECYFNLNEIDIGTPPPGSLYTFDNLVIEARKLDLRSIGNDPMFHECESLIPDGVSLDHPVKISFDVSFPMERESFLAINAELPTKNFDVSLEYKTLEKDIQVVGQNFVSSRFGPNEIKQAGSTSIRFAYEGWMCAKNGIVFCWWKR